jgi:hypothetical protein
MRIIAQEIETCYSPGAVHSRSRRHDKEAGANCPQGGLEIWCLSSRLPALFFWFFSFSFFWESCLEHMPPGVGVSAHPRQRRPPRGLIEPLEKRNGSVGNRGCWECFGTAKLSRSSAQRAALQLCIQPGAHLERGLPRDVESLLPTRVAKPVAKGRSH